MSNAARAPRVSVIMNGYNSERYLAEAIDSVLSQTTGDWELVFWDNQSADRTEEIVSSYRDPRIRFFRSPEMTPLGQGRNLAVEQARGDWLAFLDCDDIWLPHKLEAQLDRVEEDAGNDVGIVYARTLSFSARGEEGETIFRYTGRDLPEGRILHTLLTEGCVIQLVSAMVRRSTYWEVGGISPEYTFAEDYYLFAAIAEKYRVLCVQAPCCKYRVHPESMTAKYKTVASEEALRILAHWSEHLTPAELRHRVAVHNTLIGVDSIVMHRQYLAGIRRIITRGSIPFLFRGVISNSYRRLIRRQRATS